MDAKLVCTPCSKGSGKSSAPHHTINAICCGCKRPNALSKKKECRWKAYIWMQALKMKMLSVWRTKNTKHKIPVCRDIKRVILPSCKMLIFYKFQKKIKL